MWYSNLSEVRRALSGLQPGLSVEELEGRLRVWGEMVIAEEAGPVDRFQVDIAISPNGGASLPVVVETGGRIPRVPDRHTNDDGTLCVALPAAYWLDYPKGLDVVAYIQGPLRHHLVVQAYFELKGKWLMGEWAHGLGGVRQFYSGVLGAESPDLVVALLDLVRRRKVGLVGECPCRSGKHFRACHAPRVYRLRSPIHRRLAENALKALRIEAGRLLQTQGQDAK